MANTDSSTFFYTHPNRLTEEGAGSGTATHSMLSLTERLCVRWGTGSRSQALGQPAPWALLAGVLEPYPVPEGQAHPLVTALGAAVLLPRKGDGVRIGKDRRGGGENAGDPLKLSPSQPLHGPAPWGGGAVANTASRKAGRRGSRRDLPPYFLQPWPPLHGVLSKKSPQREFICYPICHHKVASVSSTQREKRNQRDLINS